MTRRSALLCLALLLPASAVHARQAAAPPSGQWIGTLPAGPGLEMEINLDRKGAEWYGTISVPQQGTKGLPLGEVTVKSQTVTFALKGAPGDPDSPVSCQLTARRSAAPSHRAADPCRSLWLGRGRRSSRSRRRARR